MFNEGNLTFKHFFVSILQLFEFIIHINVQQRQLIASTQACFWTGNLMSLTLTRSCILYFVPTILRSHFPLFVHFSGYSLMPMCSLVCLTFIIRFVDPIAASNLFFQKNEIYLTVSFSRDG